MPASFPSHLAAAESPASANGVPSLSDRVKGLRLGDQMAGAKSGGGSSWLPWLLCLIMAVTWASFAIRAYTSGGWKALIGRGDAEASSTIGMAPSTGDKVNKPVAPVAALGEKVHEGKGNLIAAHQIQVSPVEVSGRIISLAIEEGKFFKKGALLAELDDTPYRADFEESKASLASAQAKFDELQLSWPLEIKQAKAQVAESKAVRDQFDADYKRFQEVRESNSGVADKEFDQAKYGFLTQTAKVTQMELALTMIELPRKLRIAAAEAEVRAAKARFDRSQWRLSNCRIVAPVDGIVLSKRAEVGNLLNALAMNATLNGGICEMADLTDLEVDIDIQERDISKIEVGNYCTVQADAYPQLTYHARVARIMPIANSSKAVIPIRVRVRVPRDEEGKFLKPQMGAVVNFFNRKADPEPKDPLPPMKSE